MKELLLRILAAEIKTPGIPCSPDHPGGACVEDGSGIVSTIIVWAYVIIALIAVIIFIVAGFQYITSEGEPEKTKRAQATITYTIIGLIIATAAAAIISFVTGAFS